ncbi:MAG: hypothetical protein ACJ72N_00960 [Labedaea sp.]
MAPDLRSQPCDEVIARVQSALDTKFDPATEVRKRRSVGFQTDRNTWVRIEVRSLERIDGQGWNGVECAAVLRGVAKPDWVQGLSWVDAERGVAWRADETEFIADRPIKPGGILTVEPELDESWWATLNASLTALAGQATTRLAVPQGRVTERIERVFPGQVGTVVDEWAPAHGDLAWANLTAPDCFLLDWEDWGMAPRGYDAACLWRESLAVPALAERVRRERRIELDSRSGKLAQLYVCAGIVGATADYAGPHLEPAKAAAVELLSDLRA